MDALSRRQHAAEEAWAREAQELAASAHRERLQKTKGGAERLARALPPRAPAASMLPSIAAQYLRLGAREEVRACASGPRQRRQSRSSGLRARAVCAPRLAAGLPTDARRVHRPSAALSSWRTASDSLTAFFLARSCAAGARCVARPADGSPRVPACRHPPSGVCTGHPLFVRDVSMGSRLSISGSKCVAPQPQLSRARCSRVAQRVSAPALRSTAPHTPFSVRRWIASSATVDGVSLFDVKGGVKLMEGAQSVLPPQRALPTAHETVVQLGELRLKLLPDLTRTRPPEIARADAPLLSTPLPAS